MFILDGTPVCKEWLTYMNFHAWFKSLELEKNGVDEKELRRRNLTRRILQFDAEEKDFIYSPDTVVLAARPIIQMVQNATKFGTGVTKTYDSNVYSGRHQYYTGYITVYGKRKLIGTRYRTEMEAAAVMKMTRSKYIDTVIQR